MHSLTKLLYELFDTHHYDDADVDELIKKYLTSRDEWLKTQLQLLLNPEMMKHFEVETAIDLAFELEKEEKRLCECGMDMVFIGTDWKCPNCSHVLNKKQPSPEEVPCVDCGEKTEYPNLFCDSCFKTYKSLDKPKPELPPLLTYDDDFTNTIKDLVIAVNILITLRGQK